MVLSALSRSMRSRKLVPSLSKAQMERLISTFHTKMTPQKRRASVRQHSLFHRRHVCQSLRKHTSKSARMQSWQKAQSKHTTAPGPCLRSRAWVKLDSTLRRGRVMSTAGMLFVSVFQDFGIACSNLLSFSIRPSLICKRLAILHPTLSQLQVPFCHVLSDHFCHLR
jgi:hypothetical protein